MRGWRISLGALALTLCAGIALAQSDPSITAKRAAAQLEAASVALQEAEGARDRVAALTRTVQAYEEGLLAMREGMRRAAIRQEAIRLKFAAKREEVAQLLGVMQVMQSAPAPLLLLHPSGPIGTARSGMILSDVAPAMQAEAEALREELEEVALLRSLQESSAEALREGLRGVQQARTELSQAISDRTDLPRRFVEDPAQTAILLASSETLAAFASGLSQIGNGEAISDLPDFDSLKGTLPLPVAGIVLRGYDEADAAGIRRPGLLVAARPLSIVTTPTVATIRYRGPLLDYGNVMILEPGQDYLLVLAGLNHVYGEIGDVLPAGAPVGLMGGAEPDVSEFLSVSGQGGGAERSETLYIELRQGTEPVDPVAWFTLTKE